ncbi:MAG: hypothetical protein AB7S48_15270 [Bacteroidales bacterium]
MPKKRAKQKHCNNQKVVRAKHRNDFLKKLDGFCRTLTGENVLKFIPHGDLDKIYLIRSRSITVEACREDDIPPKFIEVVKSVVNSCMKLIPVPIEKTGKTVPVADMYYLGFALHVYLLLINDSPNKNAQRVKELLCPTCGNLDQLFDSIYNRLIDEIFPYLVTVTNNPCHYYFSYSLITEDTGDALGARFRIVVKKHPPEKIDITIDNKVRPAFRLGWTSKFNGFEWLFVTPAQLGINTAFDNLPIPIYIQMHALKRLVERIDCIHPAFSVAGVYFSLRGMNVIKDHSKYIIELKVLGVKVGYLVAVMIEGKLVIRTFLFLTSSGTPEGKRLEEYIGLQKLDTQYLKMDKLSSFMSSKLNSNNELRSTLTKANCLHLLELHDQLDRFIQIHPENSPLEILNSYLKNDSSELDSWSFVEN